MAYMLGSFVPAGAQWMHYLMKGLNLIRVKGLKRYVVVKMSINLVLVAFALVY